MIYTSSTRASRSGSFRAEVPIILSQTKSLPFAYRYIKQPPPNHHQSPPTPTDHHEPPTTHQLPTTTNHHNHHHPTTTNHHQPQPTTMNHQPPTNYQPLPTTTTTTTQPPPTTINGPSTTTKNTSKRCRSIKTKHNDIILFVIDMYITAMLHLKISNLTCNDKPLDEHLGACRRSCQSNSHPACLQATWFINLWNY